MTNNIDPGDIKKLTCSAITDEDGNVGNPDSLRLEVRRPDGEMLIFVWPEGAITEDKEGTFSCRVELTEAGAWEYRWRATGIQFSERGTIFVGTDTIDADPFPGEDFTVAEVWGRSPMLKGLYPDGAGDGDLVLLVAAAAPLVGSLTGRIIAGTEGEAVPDGMLELAFRAIAMKAEALYGAVGTQDARIDGIERSRLRSIAAGSWSESYWGPGEAAKGKALDPDPALAEILWALTTEAKREEWRELWEGTPRPASAIEAFNYSSRPGGYYSPFGRSGY